MIRPNRSVDRLTVAQRAIALGLLVVGLAVAASSSQIHGWLLELLSSIESVVRNRPLAGATAFVAFAALSAMLAFVSSAAIVPIGVFVWGKVVTTTLLLLGWTVGGICAYSLSRSLGRAAVRAFVSSTHLERYGEQVSREAPFGLVLLFQLALPSEIPSYALGLIRYDFRKYLAAFVLAELPYAVATVYLGASFLERRIALMVAIGVVVVAFSASTLTLLHRRMRRQTARLGVGSPRTADGSVKGR